MRSEARTFWLMVVVAMGCSPSSSSDERLATHPEPLPSICLPSGGTHQATITRSCDVAAESCLFEFGTTDAPPSSKRDSRLVLTSLRCLDHTSSLDYRVGAVALAPGERATCTLDFEADAGVDVVDAIVTERRTMQVGGDTLRSATMALAEVSLVPSTDLCPEVSFLGRGGICGGTGGSAATGGTSIGCGKPPNTFFCTGNCSVCDHALGQCVPNPNVCWGDCSECVGLGHQFNCRPKPSACPGNCDECVQDPNCPKRFSCEPNPALCTGDCDQCVKQWDPFRYDCLANETQCPGGCSSCIGSGTQFSCAETGCSPGLCSQCGAGKIKTCDNSCTWSACVTGSCE